MADEPHTSSDKSTKHKILFLTNVISGSARITTPTNKTVVVVGGHKSSFNLLLRMR